jgi:hypothetical protein
MKSPYNEMNEDKDERVEKREERKRERREDKFGVSTSSTDGTTKEIEGASDFKIRPFIKSVEQLKSQVQSEIFGIQQILDNRGSGYQSARTYESKFNAILEIIDKITSKMNLIKDKEGRNLEPNDLADIKIFRGLYTTASNDFLAAQKEWAEKKLEDENKYLSDLKDTDTNNFIFSANKLFDEAKAMLNEFIRNSKIAGTTTSSGAQGAGNLAAGDIIKGGKYTKDSKEGKIVIEVKKTIYNKFKKYLGKTKDWGIVYKSGVDNVSGTLLGNTQNVIKGVKAGLIDDYPELKSDKTGDITPAFVTIINKVSESKNNTSSRLITFENFIKSKITEAFNQDAAESAMSGRDSSNNSGENNSDKPKVKVPEYSATPFKDETEGNTFREWVNKYQAEWAKSNNLDAKGPKDNTYIRKAYQEFSEEYKKSKEAPASVKKDKATNAEMDEIMKVIKGYGNKPILQFTTDTKEPVIAFSVKGKGYAHLFNTRTLIYNTSGGKSFSGIYDEKTNKVTFPEDKSFDLKSVVLFTISDELTSEKAETAQGKKAYVASSKGTTVYRREDLNNVDYSGNVIIKYDSKDKLIGMVTSTTKANNKTFYKLSFSEPIRPGGSSSFDDGWVKADSVYLK